MRPFTVHEGLVGPMDRANVDTDLMIPKQFLKSIRRSGFGPNLFDPLRYLDEGSPGIDNATRKLNPEFPLNFPRYDGASILLARENFGCGSSREHAAWAMEDYGFRCVIAPSFADIFSSNALKNGILPVAIATEVVDQLFEEMLALQGYRLEVDLVQCHIKTPTGAQISFEVDSFRRDCLLEGLDDIGITLKSKDEIRAFEQAHRENNPWLFEDIQL